MVQRLEALRVAPEIDATGYVSGAAQVEAANERMARSAVATGSAVQQSGAKITVAGNLVGQLSNRYVEGYSNAVRFDKALQNLGRAIDSGNATMAQAEAILEGMYRKHGLVANATDLAAGGQHQLAAAVDAVNARMPAQEALVDATANAQMRLAATSRNSAFQVQNLGYQFNDIAMMIATGQSPFMIAAQQGLQVNQILGPMGLRGSVNALGSALFTLLSPTTLVTVGMIGLTAAAFQWLGAVANGGEDAEDALEAHARWLDEILAGYDSARDAARRVVEEAEKLPQGAVVSDLGVKQAESMERYDAALQSLITHQTAYLEQYIRDYATFQEQDLALEQARSLMALQAEIDAANPRLDDLITKFTELRNRPGTFNMVQLVAQQMLDLALEAKKARAEVEATKGAIEELAAAPPVNIAQQVYYRTSGDFVSGALAELGGMAPNNLSKRERADQLFEEASALAATTGQVAALAEAHGRVIAALEEEERIAEREKLTERAKAQQESYTALVQSAHDRIASTELERQALELTTIEVDRLRIQQELYNEALRAGINLTPQQAAELTNLAERATQANAALRGAQISRDLEGPFDALKREIAELDSLMAAGALNAETYGRAVGMAYANAGSEVFGSLAGMSAMLSQAFEDNKALAVATAVLKGLESITSSYAAGAKIGGPALGALYAGVAAAATAAQVAKITAVTKETATAPSVASTPSVPNVSGPQGILRVSIVSSGGASDSFTGDAVRNLVETITQAQRDGYTLVAA